MTALKSIFHLAVIILLFSCPVFSQNYWQYTMNPDTEGWASLTLKERIAAQQIPEQTLKNMSTDEIFQAWLDLPARLELLAFNTMQKGFNVTKERYNVLPALLKRQDVGSIVLKRYLTINPVDLAKESKPVEKGKFITDIGFIELFLSQTEVLNSLTHPEKEQLFKTTLLNLRKKQNFQKSDNDFFWIESGLILAGRLLDNVNHAEFKEKMEIHKEIKNALILGEITSELEYEKLYDAIISASTNF